jgi:pimeloyl-ACP methyl ester carboxylesterase
MPAIPIDHTTLECVERGAGEPLLFVHGSASDLRTWQVQQDEFASDYRTIAYSRRFHWPNAPIAAGASYSMLEHVADLAALIERLDIAPAHLIGHSYGGFVSLLLALDRTGIAHRSRGPAGRLRRGRQTLSGRARLTARVTCRNGVPAGTRAPRS